MNAPLVYIIAGEASGDLLGARLMAALKARNPLLRFAGIGGAQMQAEGFTSRIPMQELSLMGFAEVLPHILRLKTHIRSTVADILEKRPQLIVTIDSPGFNFRVARALKEAQCGAPRIHYVAPTVWAYKPERAKITADLFNHLLTILPFEAPYFEPHGLPVTFVGHPAAWDWHTLREDSSAGAGFRARHGIPAEALVVGVMPGSRSGELKQHLPVFGRTLHLLHRVYRHMQLVIPTAVHLAPHIEHTATRWGIPYHLSLDATEKQSAFAACTVALAKSGTVTIEAAMARLPMITAYKAHPLSAAIVRRMIKTPYVNLINILCGKEVIPEFLQARCRAKFLAPALESLINDSHTRSAQIDASTPALVALGLNQARAPADIAAEVILNRLKEIA